MAKALVTTRSSVTVYDLTVEGILPDGPNPVNSSDSVDGMFLRSRIDWSNLLGASRPTIDANAGASSTGVANIFQVMQIPDRAVLHELMIAATSASTAPTHGHTGSAGGTTLLNFQVAAYTTASKSTLKFDANGMGTLTVTNSGGAIAGFPTLSASTPETRMKGVTSSSAGTPIFCPFGGFIELQMSGGASTSAISADGAFAGTMEIVVRASKLPE